MITNKNLCLFFTFCAFISLSACNSNEIGDSKDVAQDKIYQEYSISYNEGNTNAEIFCQYRFGGKNGTTLVLNTPSNVAFDGEKLTVDSSNTSGAFYKTSKPIVNFWGKHKVVFTNVEKKQYENSFAFDSFKLSFPSSAAKNNPLKISLNSIALGADDYIEINNIDSDSSFSISNDGNYILIPAEELKRQKKNIVKLEARLYRKIPLEQNTPEGGKMHISYRLKAVNVKLN